MVVLANRAKMSTTTTGTGTITLGSAEDGYQTFADAGVIDGDVVRYVIEDGSNWEIGTGTYTASGTTLSRTVSESSNSDAAINLSGSATVFVSATSEDFDVLDVATLGTSEASKVVTADANGVVIFSDGVVEDETSVTSSGSATTVNCRDGNVFSHTLSENTTFTFSNAPASGLAFSFTLKIVQDSGANGYSVTWPASVDWPESVAPTLSSGANDVDMFVFLTTDGGTTWYGFAAGFNLS